MIALKFSRPNATAQGMTKNAERRKRLGKEGITNPAHPEYNREKQTVYLRLVVKGTNDALVCRLPISKRVKKEHATDKGYFKEVFVLSDTGKFLLRKYKNN